MPTAAHDPAGAPVYDQADAAQAITAADAAGPEITPAEQHAVARLLRGEAVPPYILQQCDDRVIWQTRVSPQHWVAVLCDNAGTEQARSLGWTTDTLSFWRRVATLPELPSIPPRGEQRPRRPVRIRNVAGDVGVTAREVVTVL